MNLNVVSYVPIGPRLRLLVLFHESPLFVFCATAHQVGSAIFSRASLLMMVSSSVLIAGFVSARLLMNSSRPLMSMTFMSSQLIVNVSVWAMRAVKKSVIGFLACLPGGTVESKAILLPPMSMFILIATTCWSTTHFLASPSLGVHL